MRQGDSGGPAVPPAPRLVVVLSLLVMVLVPPCQAGSRGGHQILWGRCYSHCIQRHLLLAAPSTPDGQEAEPDTLPGNPIRACHRHRNCRWCLYVCERPEKNFTNSTACLRDCRFTRTRPRSGGRQACTEACGFVGRASSARGGKCPAPLSLNGFQSACITSCHRDGDCSRAEEKCCSNNCGAVCTKPFDVHILPPVPSNISFKMLKTGGVMVKWSLGNSSQGAADGGGGSKKAGGALWAGSPVVYILRWWCPYTSGAVNSVTDRARTKLQGYPSGIYPGSKCHFMVAAVNGHGSQGFSRVSPYIKKFLTPSPPLHLDKVRSRLHKDGLVDVTVQWQPPVYTDGLPVFKYQVFWSDHLPEASPSYMRFHMYRRVLDADKTTFVLQSLRPGTLYFVQVRAVVRWKGRQKRGELASAYIETYSPPHPHTPQREDEGGGGGKEEGEEDRGGSMIESVTVNQTFFHNTVLKAAVTWTLKPNKRARKYLIYWRAETCARSDHRKLHHRLETSATSHDRSFILYNLQPECEYAVRVHPVSKRGLTGAATVTNFVTPPCHVIHVQQGEPPTCHTADPPGQVQGLHSETSGCITLIRWEPPSSKGDDVEGYDVMWGETEAGVFSMATIIYTSSPHEVSVPANVTKLEVGRLRSGQHYSIQVRAQSVGGSSPPSLLHLRAPFPSQPCAASSSSASSHGSESPADETGRHSNSTLTSSRESESDANDTSDVSGNATTGSPSFPSENHPGDVSSNRTGDVSITLDVTDKPGDRVVGRGGDGVSMDSSEEGGERKGGGATPTPDPTSSSTKDFTDAAISGGELSGDGSQNRTEPVRGVLHGGDNSGLTLSMDTTTYVDLDTTVFYPGEGGSTPLSDIPRIVSTASASPGVRGAGKTLQASPWTLVVCCVFLCRGVLR